MPASELLPRLKQTCPGLHVIVLSARSEAKQDALASGADAFVSKMDHPERLLAAMGSAKRTPAPEPAQNGGVVAEYRRPGRDGRDRMAVDEAGAVAPAAQGKRGG